MWPFKSQKTPLSSELGRKLEVFEVALKERLKQLKPHEEDCKSINNLAWLSRSMEALSATYGDLSVLVRAKKLESDDKWTDEYTIFTLEILHFCVAVNAQIGKLQGTQLLLRYALYLLDFSDGVPSSKRILVAKDYLRDAGFNYRKHNEEIGIFTTKLEALSKTLEGKGKVKYMSSSSSDVLMRRALYGVKAITVFVCGSLAWILFMCSSSSESESSRHLINSNVNLRIVPEFLWSASFVDLQKEVITQQTRSNDQGLDELESLQAAAKALYSFIQSMPLLAGNENRDGEGEEEQIKIRMAVHVDEFKHKLERVDEDLRNLRNQVDGFFQTLVNRSDAFIHTMLTSSS